MHMIDLTAEDSPLMPRIGPKEFLNAVRKLKVQCKSKSVSLGDFLCPEEGDRIQQLFLHIRRQVSCKFRCRFRTYYFNTLNVLLEEIGWRVQVMAVFRPLLDLILWILPVNESGNEPIALLRALCRTALSPQASKPSGEGLAIAWHIQEIIAGLAVKATMCEAGSDAQLSCLQCIQEVFSTMPDQLHCCFELLVPFPSMGIFKALNSFLNKQQGSRSLAKVIFFVTQGLEIAPADNNQIRAGLLHCLLRTIKSHKHELVTMLNSLAWNSTLDGDASLKPRGNPANPMQALLIAKLTFNPDSTNSTRLLSNLLGFLLDVCATSPSQVSKIFFLSLFLCYLIYL